MIARAKESHKDQLTKGRLYIVSQLSWAGYYYCIGDNNIEDGFTDYYFDILDDKDPHYYRKVIY